MLPGTQTAARRLICYNNPLWLTRNTILLSNPHASGVKSQELFLTDLFGAGSLFWMGKSHPTWAGLGVKERPSACCIYYHGCSYEETWAPFGLGESNTAHAEKATEKELPQCYCVKAEYIKSSPLSLPASLPSFCLCIISTQKASLGSCRAGG